MSTLQNLPDITAIEEQLHLFAVGGCSAVDMHTLRAAVLLQEDLINTQRLLRNMHIGAIVAVPFAGDDVAKIRWHTAEVKS